MAHEGLFATSDQILVKAGENYDTSITEARINRLCLEAESLINVLAQYNFSDWFTASDTTTKNADVRHLLGVAESAWVAMQIISYNTNSYASRGEATLMLNVLRDEFNTAILALKDAAKVDFMSRA